MKCRGHVAILTAAAVMSLLLFFPAHGYSCGRNLSTILKPNRFILHDYPVEIAVKFHCGARPSTFRAWLNGRNITDKFEQTGNITRAWVTPEDGLKVMVQGESWCGKLNRLKTQVKGRHGTRDIDFRRFFVVVDQSENHPPVAHAGPDQTVFLGDTVVLDGSGSMDEDGDPLTFSWFFHDTPQGSQAVLDDPISIHPSFVVDVAGTYKVKLIVNDGYVDSDADICVIATENSPPVADAGPDQTVFVGDPVVLDGSGSTDVDGDPLTFDWSFVSVPEGSLAALDDPTAVNPTFTMDVAGAYEVQLIVNDGNVDSNPDTCTITTENSPPVANAGPDQTVYVSETVTLDGSGSSDVDGDLLTFDWSFVSLPLESNAMLSDPTAVYPTFYVDAPGTYVPQLVVNDGQEESEADTSTITTENSSPTAAAGPDQTVFVTDTVELDGSNSSDPDHDPLTYEWAITSSPEGSSATLSDPTGVDPFFYADLPGTYVVQLIVNDGEVDSAPDTVTITTANSPPVADAGSDQTVFVGVEVTLDGSGSSDVDNDPLTYFWSFTTIPDGSSAELSDPTAVDPTFMPDLPGIYIAQLIVNDGLVEGDPDTVTITTENSPPVADAGPDQIVFEGDTVTLDGSGSSDVDGDPLEFDWSLTGVPEGSSAELSDPTAVDPTFLADLPGTYVAQLIVNDGTVDSGPDTVTITANEQNRPPLITSTPVTTATVGILYVYDVDASDPDGD
ncbi:MAG: PKD domain-containing protein, partial [Thermodesulfobacteriota bacterium]|nr:PKD domain-containing protein [Thermodesulfobacteriota bacterium]